LPQQFDVDAARQAGASDDQILSYLSQRAPGFDVQGALRQAPKQEVIGYLSTHSAPPGALNPPPAAGPHVQMKEMPLSRFQQSMMPSEMPGASEGANLAEALGNWTEQGPGGVVVSGPRDILRGNIARGAHKMLSGAGTTMLPALPFVGAAAPVATAAALGTGSAGQYAGQKGAEALGATPDQADLVGDITGLAAGYGGAKVPGMVSKLRAPLGDLPVKPRGTTPPESFSPAELKAYADDNGIPLNAAQATEHNFPRNLQSAGERASVGGTAVRQQIKASQAAVADHTEALMDTVSPKTPDTATAGSVIQQNVAKALETEQLASRQEYAAVDAKAKGMKVYLAPLRETAEKVLTDTTMLRKTGLDPKSATRILTQIADVPDAASFTQAQQIRSGLLDASRSPELAISNQAQAWIKQLIGTVDTEMMNAAKLKPGLEETFRGANEHWQQMQEDFNNPRSPLAQILQEPDPSKVPQKLTQRGQTGGSPYNAEILDRYGIEKGPVKRVIIQDLLNKDFRLWNRTLGGYSDDFLRSMFTPEELQHVYKTGAIARSVGLNTNPSGTAGVTGAMQDVQSPIKSLAPKTGAAALTRAPWFNKWMMQSRKAGGRTRVPLSVLLGATAGARRTGGDEE
jgi:hypothetical protein